MRKLKRAAVLAAGILILLLGFPKPNYAYIDPGTGSYVIQILIAAFISISFAVKIFWKKIKTFFRKLFKKNGHEE
jgi:hypothetical protein